MWKRKHAQRDAGPSAEPDARAAIMIVGKEHVGFSDVEELQEQFRAVARDAFAIILDIESVSTMGTGMVALLLDEDRTLREAGKTLQIVGLHGEPLELVRMCRLDRVLAIRETVEEAVRALLPEFGPSDGERLVNCFVMAPAVSAS